MPRIPFVEADNAPAELRPVFEQLRQTRGRVPGMYRLLANHPAVLSAHRAYFHAALDSGLLPRGFKEKISVLVTRLCGSVYSSASHRRYAIAQGVDEAELDAIDRSDFSGLPPAEQAALAFAQEVIENQGKVSEARCDAVKAHFSDAEFLEILAVTAVLQLGCVIGTALDLQPD
jgi:uncharacterized peroxidase-related enzyme